MRSALILALFGVGFLGCSKEAPSEPPMPETAAPKPASEPAPAKPALGVALPSASTATGADDELKELIAAEKNDPPPSQGGDVGTSAAGTAKPTPGASANPPTGNTTPGEPTGPVKIVRGAAVSDAAFSVWLETADTHGAGKQGTVTAVVTPKEPYKCNAEYPYKFQTTGGTQVTYASPTVRGASVDKKRTTLAIPFTPTQGGRGEVKGTLSFSVCTDERCLVEKRDLAVAFAIQ